MRVGKRYGERPSEVPGEQSGERPGALSVQRPGAPPAQRPQVVRPVDTVGWGMQGAAAVAVRFLAIAAASYVLLLLLNAISLVTITIVIAIMLSAVLEPPVEALCKWGTPRPLAAVLVFVVGVALLVAAGWFVVSQVSNNAAVLGDQLKDAGVAIRSWLVDGPLSLSEKQVTQIGDEITAAVSGNRSSLVAGAFATANSALGILGGAVFCLFALLFMLLDDGAMWRWVVRVFPRQARPKVAEAGMVAWRTLIAYMRSTVLLALINSLTMVVVMLIAGLPLVVPLGVLLFLGSLIPLAGMLVAGVVVVLIALVTKGVVVAIVMAIALFLTVQLEGNLLNPYILGKAVSIHPLAILIAVTGGTLVGGIFGAFVAVPFVAILNNVVKTVRTQPDGPDPPDQP